MITSWLLSVLIHFQDVSVIRGMSSCVYPILSADLSARIYACACVFRQRLTDFKVYNLYRFFQASKTDNFTVKSTVPNKVNLLNDF